MVKFVLVAALSVAACAAQQKPKQAPVAYSTPGQPVPAGKEQCHMERVTGSNLMEKVCYYREADDDARRETQDAMIRLQTSGAQGVTRTPGGG